jgi:hypothetical protein
MMQQSLHRETKRSDNIKSPSVTAENIIKGFDDMIRDSAGNVNQCTDEIIAATIDKFWELLSETDQYTIIEWMVDTGCGTIVAHS